MIPSKGKAVFLLSYEELLHRRLGKYEHVVSVRPQQLVGRLTVEVNILERAGLSSLEVLPPQDTRQRHGGRAEGECPPPRGTPASRGPSRPGAGFREVGRPDGCPCQALSGD